MAKDKSPFSQQDVVAYITAHPDCLVHHPKLLAQCLAEAKSVDADTDPGQLNLGMVNPHMANIVDLSPALAARARDEACLLYTSPSPRDLSTSRMPSSA